MNKPGEALRSWIAAAESRAKARNRGPRGLESGLIVGPSPFPSLAVALARAGRPGDAWTRWEEGLARGVLDEVAGRALRPLTAAEKGRENELLSRSQATDERIGRLLGRSTRTQEEDRQLDELRRQEGELRRQWLEREQQLEARYGAAAGKPAGLEDVRRAIPEPTALVGWVDAEPYHWACVLRRTGDPTWVRLPGSGPEGDWTGDDETLARRLREALDPEVARGDVRALAGALARQRLGPLADHLEGVRHLIVLTSPGLAGVPVEVLVAAPGGPRRDDPVVSYAPSASMLAHLAGKHQKAGTRPATLLAVGDPAYPEPRPDLPAAQPPDGGIVLTRVEPFGNADLNGLRAADVLLEYAGQALRAPDDLRVVAADADPRMVPVKFWREGEVRTAEVAAGPLGVALDVRPAAPVVLGRREAARVLRGTRAQAWTRLPGTRREVEAIAGLFPDGGVTTLLGEQARESAVQELARAGKQRGFRFLHFATHGESDPRNAYRSSLALVADDDRSSDPEAFEADGVITADEIARTWDLDADLVVLSACESGLGRAAGGEGYLGFAQALFAKGARSLVLSLWKVDDDVTALLMTRFYQNLLGRRTGLAAPMPKAEALAEAKRWLQEATAEEAGAVLAALPRPRGEIVRREPAPRGPVNRPYKDPTYWSGFILVGNPE